jgi:biotin synthase-like enzyme
VSNKTECPACGSYTSSIYDAFECDDNCPYCGLPAEAAKAINEARERGADKQLVERALAAEKRAAEMETELRRLRWRMSRLKDLINADLDEED